MTDIEQFAALYGNRSNMRFIKDNGPQNEDEIIQCPNNDICAIINDFLDAPLLQAAIQEFDITLKRNGISEMNVLIWIQSHRLKGLEGLRDRLAYVIDQELKKIANGD